MIRKLLFGALFVALAAVLVVGAINRTHALLDNGDGDSHQANGNGNQNRDGNTRGGDTSETGGGGHDEQVFDGVVVELSESGLVIETATGAAILVSGRPWRYVQEQNFPVTAGDSLRVVAFYEDGAYKVVSLDHAETGIRVQLRDETGAPAWRGGGGGNS